MSKALTPFDVCFFGISHHLAVAQKKTQLHHVNCSKVVLCFICNMGDTPKNRTIGIKNHGPGNMYRLLSNMAGRSWGIHSFLGHGLYCGFMLVQGAIESPTGMLQCWHCKKWCFPKAWRRAFHSAALGKNCPRKMSETPQKCIAFLCRCWSPWSVQWISCLKMVIDKECRLASPFKMEIRLS